MKRQLGFAAAVLIGAASMGFPALAGVPTHGGSRPNAVAATPLVLRYLDVRTETESLDLGRLGGDPSPGDAYYFGSTLRFHATLSTADRPPAGRFLSTCVIVIGSQAKCSGALIIQGGTIEVAGTPDFASPDPIEAIVVGGTGRYNGVSGTVTITPTGNEGVSDLVVHLDS